MHLDPLALGSHVAALGTLVVLDVAGTAARPNGHHVDVLLTLELGEDLGIGPPDCVGEHVQPPAVRHPDEGLAHARVGGEAEGLVEHRDQRVQSFDREALLAEEGPVEVGLERLRFRQQRERTLFLLRGERPAVLARLDPLPQPDALLVVGDVLDLVRDRAAVDRA